MENSKKLEFYERLARIPLIEHPVIPEPEQKLKTEAEIGTNDITLYSWRNEWLRNLVDNKAHFRYFNRDHSVKVFYNELKEKPIILVGAGPSLEKNIDYLRFAKEKGIKIMASNHSYMYMIDRGIKPDFVCVLDAGSTWSESFRLGMPNEDIVLIAEQACNTAHLKEWKGPVYFYRSICPETTNIGKFILMETKRIVKDDEWASQISVGGHTMGAMLSLAKGIMNAQTFIIVGADYCYSPDTDYFYPFKSQYSEYDDIQCPPKVGAIYDIIRNTVATDPAYLSFKNIMDEAIRGLRFADPTSEVINATEGGALGAMEKGNSCYMRYLRLEDALIQTCFKYGIN